LRVASILKEMKRLEKALQLYEELEVAIIKLFGKDHYDLKEIRENVEEIKAELA